MKSKLVSTFAALAALTVIVGGAVFPGATQAMDGSYMEKNVVGVGYTTASVGVVNGNHKITTQLGCSSLYTYTVSLLKRNSSGSYVSIRSTKYACAPGANQTMTVINPGSGSYKVSIQGPHTSNYSIYLLWDFPDYL